MIMIARYIHWEVCRKRGLEKASKWYDHKPPAVLENEESKILRDFNIQCDHVIEARMPDIVVIDKDKECLVNK
jgi:hypothetical protein